MAALNAECSVADAVRWHIVPDADGAALCHRLLSPIAETRPITCIDHDDLEEGQLCPQCRTAFEHAPHEGAGDHETDAGAD